MVKIYRRSCRRSYRKGKSDYKYYRLYKPIPAKFKTTVEPFLDKELEVDIKAVEKDQILIIMAQVKPSIEIS